jgi:glycosyltransferase involved in cell wall biosynthesis
VNHLHKKKVVIAFSSVPFVRGGAELLVETLHLELIKRDFQCEIISLPFKWYPKDEILKHAFAWRFLDLSESNGQKIDLVIATKFPSYWVKHDNKVTWLIQQFRQAYDLNGTSYSDFDDSKETDRILRQEIQTTDNITLNESRQIYSISKNTSQRLKTFNGIASKHLYHPPSLVGRYNNSGMGEYILSVGRLDSLKRVDLLINSIRYLNSSAKCIIVGRGPEEKSLKKLVRRILHR